MKESKLLNTLIELINEAKKLRVDYGITGQEINEGDNIVTFSSNIFMEVNYEEKRGKKTTIRSDFSSTNKIEEIFENNECRINKTYSNEKEDFSETVNFSDEDYNKLFFSGGELYPLQLNELIPVESQMNNKNCQICVPSEVLEKSIPGHIKSTYAIYKKSETYYDITMILSQMDKETQKVLMQYCNTKIYIELT